MAANPARRIAAQQVLRPVINRDIEIRSDPAKGRGVFSRSSIVAGALIDQAPVIIVPAAQCALLDRTVLHDYYFRWGEDGSAAVALGLVSLCNHSRRPCARVRRNHAQATLELVALAPIAAGDEITIDYNCRLWFQPA